MNVFRQSADEFVGSMAGMDAWSDPPARVAASALWQAYMMWCKACGMPIASRQVLSKSLVAGGAVRCKNSRIVYDITPIVCRPC